eukprot:m.70225 g.70225  ORF g.70225 m.70225 type:complete len:423 (-) comp7581_c0_seq1:384-1652(-)
MTSRTSPGGLLHLLDLQPDGRRQLNCAGGGHGGDKRVDCLDGDVLHDNRVGQQAVGDQPVVHLGRKIVLGHDRAGRPREVDRVGVRIAPDLVRPEDRGEAVLQVPRVGKHRLCLGLHHEGPAVRDLPPELQWRKATPRARDRRDCLAEVLDAEGIQVLPHLLRAQKQPARLVEAEELVPAHGDRVELHLAAVDEMRELGEWQVSAEESRVEVAIHGDGLLALDDGIDRLLIIDRALERRAHGNDYQGRPHGIKLSLKLLDIHAAANVGRDQAQLDVVDVGKLLDAVVRLGRDVCDRPALHRRTAVVLRRPAVVRRAELLLQLLLLLEVADHRQQVPRPEVHAVLVAVRAAGRHEAPVLAGLKAVQRREEMDHLALKWMRVEIIFGWEKGVPDVVDRRLVQAALEVPLVELLQVGVLVDGIAQ